MRNQNNVSITLQWPKQNGCLLLLRKMNIYKNYMHIRYFCLLFRLVRNFWNTKVTKASLSFLVSSLLRIIMLIQTDYGKSWDWPLCPVKYMHLINDKFTGSINAWRNFLLVFNNRHITLFWHPEKRCHETGNTTLPRHE